MSEDLTGDRVGRTGDEEVGMVGGRWGLAVSVGGGEETDVLAERVCVCARPHATSPRSQK